MTSPDVPLRMEMRFELPGTPAQVWDAIATAGGISAWFLPTDLEEREGGAIVTHMGPDDASHGTVTGWDPPRRFAYEEPDWAGLTGHPGANVTPLATEFLVEAQSGGTCVVRVVSSAFGTGADWEGEFFEHMETYWAPFFDILRLYLTDFPGQRATLLDVSAQLPGDASDVSATMRRLLGVDKVGQQVELHGLSGVVESLGPEEPPLVLVRLREPGQGVIAVYAYGAGEGTAMAGVRGYLFSDDAADVVERERPRWRSWLESLPASVT